MEGNREVMIDDRSPSSHALRPSSGAALDRFQPDYDGHRGDSQALRERLIAATVEAVADGSVARLPRSRSGS